MKLTQQQSEYLVRALKTAQIFKCESLVLEKNLLRTMNTDRTVVIADTNVPPNLPFEAMGVHDVVKAASRLSLLDNYSIELDADQTGKYVLAMNAKSTSTTVKYRCANPKSIKTPRKAQDKYKWAIQFNPEVIAKISKASSAMGNSPITLICDAGNCSISILDDTKNEFVYKFPGNPQHIYDDEDDGEDDELPITHINFNVTYQASVFLAALKYAEEIDLPPTTDDTVKRTGKTVEVQIGEYGSMKFTINTITALLSPVSLT